MSKREIAIAIWHDPFSINDSGISKDSSKLAKPYVRRSAGWLIRRRPLVIAQTWDLGQDGEDGDLRDTLSIPRSLVKKLTVVEVIEGEDDA